MIQLISPSGEVVKIKEVKGKVSEEEIPKLVELFVEAKKAAAEVNALIYKIRELVSHVAEYPENRQSALLIGDRDTLVVHKPKSDYSQSGLKDVLARFPEIAGNWIEPETYKISAANQKKLAASKGNAAFRRFKEALEFAKSPPGVPYVEVKKVEIE